jgi:predicted Zn-dependent protease
MHARMRAKLTSFLRPPEQVFQTYKGRENSVEARYALAVAYHRDARIDRALQAIDSLIKESPNDPYFHELRGQILFENQRVVESIPAYEKAVALLPNNDLLKLGLAQSLIEVNDATRTQQAVKLLASVSEDERRGSYWRLMAVAYDRQGNVGMRLLAQAELGYARGDRPEAVQNARRAQQALPKGSPAWQRAQDIEFLAKKRRDDN